MQALLIIDIQNDYFPGGRAELVNPEAALANAEKLLAAFRADGLPVIHVQHVSPRDDAPFFRPDTEGVKIHERLTPRTGEDLVVKNYPNSFHKTNLHEIIRSKKISELVVCGMMTHICIDTTVRSAKDRDLPVTLIADACTTKNLEFQGVSVPAVEVQAALMAALSGTFAKVINRSQFSL